jgi:hypothetical protein
MKCAGTSLVDYIEWSDFTVATDTVDSGAMYVILATEGPSLRKLTEVEVAIGNFKDCIFVKNPRNPL